MASKQRANAENIDENDGISNDDSDVETRLKRDKTRTKSFFTRSKNKLIFLIEKRKSPSEEEIEDAVERLDGAMESVMDALTSLSDLYLTSKETENSKRVVLEMERIEEEFTSTYEAARRFLETQKEQASERSDILSIDMNISNGNEERKDTLTASSIDCHTGSQLHASQASSMDWHSGVPMHEAWKKVGLDSSMSQPMILHAIPPKCNRRTI